MKWSFACCFFCTSAGSSSAGYAAAGGDWAQAGTAISSSNGATRNLSVTRPMSVELSKVLGNLRSSVVRRRLGGCRWRRRGLDRSLRGCAASGRRRRRFFRRQFQFGRDQAGASDGNRPVDRAIPEQHDDVTSFSRVTGDLYSPVRRWRQRPVHAHLHTRRTRVEKTYGARSGWQ